MYAVLTTSIAERTKIKIIQFFLVATWFMIYRKDEYKDLKKNIEV